jgi:phosphohistidine phosphatase SixA
MLVLLLRHGHDDRQYGDDPLLSTLGAAQVRATVEVLAELCPDGIEGVWISPARRARDTAAVVRETLVTGWEQVDEGLRPGAGPARHLEIIEYARRHGLQSVLIVGHNPDLGEAALRCLGRDSGLERGLIAHGECLQVLLGERAGLAPLMVVSGTSLRSVDLEESVRAA